MIRAVGDIFVMKMRYPPYGDYEMNNHVVEYELNRRIGWEPQAGRGHPDTAPDSTAPTRWGHRWTYELTPDGLHATEIYDCSQAPQHEQTSMHGGQDRRDRVELSARPVGCGLPTASTADGRGAFPSLRRGQCQPRCGLAALGRRSTARAVQSPGSGPILRTRRSYRACAFVRSGPASTSGTVAISSWYAS